MRQRVLIIDDSDLIHLLVRGALQDEPLDLLFAEDGTRGLLTAAEKLPSLILLDVQMPAPDGFEVIRRLKESPATMSIPVIFLTGHSTTQEKIKGLDLGAVDYVTKPFDAAELRARVRASLRTKYLLDLLSQKAMIDGLTGLWNRAYLDQRLESEQALVARGGRPLSCIMVDVDHFKRINDRYGHTCGDEVLQTIAQTIAGQSRVEDVVCRYGGEEFAILLPGIDLAGAVSAAERLRSRVASSTVNCRGTEQVVTCSFGVSQATGEGCRRMIEDADAALYKAKRGGRNRVEGEMESLAEAVRY